MDQTTFPMHIIFGQFVISGMYKILNRMTTYSSFIGNQILYFHFLDKGRLS